MKKLALIVLVALSISPAFAQRRGGGHNGPGRGGNPGGPGGPGGGNHNSGGRWQTEQGVPGQYCSSGIREGDICTVGAGYMCKVDGSIWQCNYRGGAIRVSHIAYLPSSCRSGTYNGGSCSYQGERCTLNGNWIMSCGR